MDFGSMLDDSFAYAKDGVWEKWSRWLLLIVSMLIFPLILGYTVRIYRDEKPAPEPGAWLSLFVDGLKLLLVQIIYLLPVILLVILAFIPLISTLVTSGVLSQNFSSMSDSQFERWLDSHPAFIPELLVTGGFMLILLMVAIILAIIITLFSFLGVVRFARTQQISEAFNFSANPCSYRSYRLGELHPCPDHHRYHRVYLEYDPEFFLDYSGCRHFH